MNRPVLTRILAAVAATVLTVGLTSCSTGDGTSDDTARLTVYSGQHEDLANALAERFEAETGIGVDIRAGKDAEMVGQIIEEGQRSNADVVLTEEPGPIGDLDARGLLAAVPAEVLAVPDQRFVPSTGNWLPWAARSRVFFYNPDLIAEDELPKSILDLADPQWKGRFAYAPSGAFKSTTAYLINTIGADATLDWLKAMKDNGINEQKNGKVRDSVEAGQHAFGLSNHYYWYILARDRGGEQNLTSRVFFLNSDDAGALMLASGAGVVASSRHQEQAQQFLRWLASPDGGQQVVAQRSPQFPLTPGVSSDYGLPSIDDLTFPQFDQASLENVDEANALLMQSGII